MYMHIGLFFYKKGKIDIKDNCKANFHNCIKV